MLALVITVPDRFGGDARSWWELAGELAAAGHAVVVTCTDASAYELATASWAHPWLDPRPVALGSAAASPEPSPVEENVS